MARGTGPIGAAITTVFDNLGRLATYAATFATFIAGRWAAGLAAAAAPASRMWQRPCSFGIAVAMPARSTPGSVRSFKVEGRYKDMGYVKNITAHYRTLLDEIIEEREAQGRPLSRSASG